MSVPASPLVILLTTGIVVLWYFLLNFRSKG